MFELSLYRADRDRIIAGSKLRYIYIHIGPKNQCQLGQPESTWWHGQHHVDTFVRHTQLQGSKCMSVIIFRMAGHVFNLHHVMWNVIIMDILEPEPGGRNVEHIV